METLGAMAGASQGVQDAIRELLSQQKPVVAVAPKTCPNRKVYILTPDEYEEIYEVSRAAAETVDFNEGGGEQKSWP